MASPPSKQRRMDDNVQITVSHCENCKNKSSPEKATAVDQNDGEFSKAENGSQRVPQLKRRNLLSDDCGDLSLSSGHAMSKSDGSSAEGEACTDTQTTVADLDYIRAVAEHMPMPSPGEVPTLVAWWAVMDQAEFAEDCVGGSGPQKMNQSPLSGRRCHRVSPRMQIRR